MMAIKVIKMMFVVVMIHSVIVNAVSGLTVEEDAIESVPTEDQATCTNIYSDQLCNKYTALCSFNKDMKAKCKKACKICQPKPIVGPECVNRWSDTQCRKYEKLCDHHRTVQKSCKKTCGYCAAVTDLPCTVKKHGCCWDNITEAMGPNGEGCYPCKDMRPECRKLSNDCQFAAVRRQCPETCRLPCARCKDSETHNDFCPYFAKAGFCIQRRKAMKKFCAKTCKLCS